MRGRPSSRHGNLSSSCQFFPPVINVLFYQWSDNFQMTWRAHTSSLVAIYQTLRFWLVPAKFEKSECAWICPNWKKLAFLKSSMSKVAMSIDKLGFIKVIHCFSHKWIFSCNPLVTVEADIKLCGKNQSTLLHLVHQHSLQLFTRSSLYVYCMAAWPPVIVTGRL